MTHTLFKDIIALAAATGPIPPPAFWGRYIRPQTGNPTPLGPYDEIKDTITESAEWVDGQFEFEPIDQEVEGWLERHAPHYDTDIQNLHLFLKGKQTAKETS